MSSCSLTAYGKVYIYILLIKEIRGEWVIVHIYSKVEAVWLAVAGQRQWQWLASLGAKVCATSTTSTAATAVCSFGAAAGNVPNPAEFHASADKQPVAADSHNCHERAEHPDSAKPGNSVAKQPGTTGGNAAGECTANSAAHCHDPDKSAWARHRHKAVTRPQ